MPTARHKPPAWFLVPDLPSPAQNPTDRTETHKPHNRRCCKRNVRLWRMEHPPRAACPPQADHPRGAENPSLFPTIDPSQSIQASFNQTRYEFNQRSIESNQHSINIQSTSIKFNQPSITPPRVIPRPREGSGAAAPTPVPVLNLFLFPPLFPLTYSVILLPDAFWRIYTLHTPHGPSTPSGPRTPQLLDVSFDQFVPSPALSAPSPGRS